MVATRNNFLADFSNNDGYGIRVDAANSIILTNVSGAENGLSGLHLVNDYAKGSITVKNYSRIVTSSFDGNGGNGIYASSLGSILLQNLSASGNLYSGAYLDACQEDDGECLGKGAITIYSSRNMESIFNNNGDHGILAFNYGTIKLTNVSASENGLSGAYLYNDYPLSRGSVTLLRSGEGTNQFNNNVQPGSIAAARLPTALVCI